MSYIVLNGVFAAFNLVTVLVGVLQLTGAIPIINAFNIDRPWLLAGATVLAACLTVWCFIDAIREARRLGYNEKPDLFTELGKAHGEWSQATFGSDAIRGPKGPVAHLRRELDEALSAETRGERDEEWADCLLLLLDASRRDGLPAGELILEAFRKLRINQARKWPAPADQTPNAPVEHLKLYEETSPTGVEPPLGSW